MKHEAKFSVVSPKGSFTAIQIETFEQAAVRYGINVQFPLRNDSAGNLIISSGLNLRDAQLLRRQVAGYGFPVDVVSDESQIEPLNTNERDITSNTTMALQAPSFDNIADWDNIQNLPLLNSELDASSSLKDSKDPTEHPTTEHVMSLSDDELLEVCRNSDENTSDDELRQRIAACLPTNEMSLSEDMKANLFSDIDSNLDTSGGHSVGIYRYKGSANSPRDVFRRSSSSGASVTKSLSKASSLGTRTVNTASSRFTETVQKNNSYHGRLNVSDVKETAIRSAVPLNESELLTDKSKPEIPVSSKKSENVLKKPEVSVPADASSKETPRHNIPVVTDLNHLPQGLSGSESLAVFIRPPNQSSDPDEDNLDDIFDSLPAPKQDKAQALPVPKSGSTDKNKSVSSDKKDSTDSEEKRIDNIIENIKPSSAENTAASSSPETENPPEDTGSPNTDSEISAKSEEEETSPAEPESLPEASEDGKLKNRKKIIIAIVFVVIVLAAAIFVVSQSA